MITFLIMFDRELINKLAVHYIAPHIIMPPTSIFISPTLRCSSKCVHCRVWSSPNNAPELSADEWERYLADHFLSRVKVLWFSGGEPTLRKDLPDLARRASDLLPNIQSITVATNALHPFRFQEYLEEAVPILSKNGIYSWFHFSLDGPPEIHDKVRGISGAFNSLERCVAAAKIGKENGLQIGWGFNCVINHLNAPFLFETEKTAAQLEGEISFNAALSRGGFYRGDGSSGVENELLRTVNSFLESLISRANPYYRRHYETVCDVLNGKARRRRCETLEATMYVDPDASVYPCPNAYDEFKTAALPGQLRDTWAQLMKYRTWIRRHKCPDCSLGCSFGEGITLPEFFSIVRGEK